MVHSILHSLGKRAVCSSYNDTLVVVTFVLVSCVSFVDDWWRCSWPSRLTPILRHSLALCTNELCWIIHHNKTSILTQVDWRFKNDNIWNFKVYAHSSSTQIIKSEWKQANKQNKNHFVFNIRAQYGVKCATLVVRWVENCIQLII